LTQDAISALGSALGLEFTTAPAGPHSTRYGILATGSDRGLLLPTDNRRAAATGVLRISNGQSQLKKMAVVAAWLGLRTGLIQRLSPRRRDPLYVDEPSSSTDDNLLAHLGAVVGREDLSFAMSVGPPRPNRKPVIQIIEPSGATVGFAKIGWNAVTSRLVRDEAGFLHALDPDRLNRLEIPKVLHHGEWKGLVVTILSPISFGPRALIRSVEPPAGVILEIAEMREGRQRTLLGDSGLVSRLRDQIGRLSSPTSELATAGLNQIIERYGQLEAEVGLWHGDFGPWNVAPGRRGRFAVWDWERAGGPQLIGMDLFHYHFQREHFRGGRIDRSLDSASAGARDTVSSIQGGDFPMGSIASVYLLERLLRYREPGAAEPRGELEVALSRLLEDLGRLRIDD